jgi:hypothetical protein
LRSFVQRRRKKPVGQVDADKQLERLKVVPAVEMVKVEAKLCQRSVVLSLFFLGPSQGNKGQEKPIGEFNMALSSDNLIGFILAMLFSDFMIVYKSEVLQIFSVLRAETWVISEISVSTFEDSKPFCRVFLNIFNTCKQISRIVLSNTSRIL